MRIHTNTLTVADLRAAAICAHVGMEKLSERGSRSRTRAFEVILSGDSPRIGQSGGYEAATWDQWGIFLAELFRRDELMTVPHIYPEVESFHWITCDRYRSLTHANQHVQHRWERVGRAVGDRYVVSECECGAAMRQFLHPIKPGTAVSDVLGMAA